jgi:hypothetical protein
VTDERPSRARAAWIALAVALLAIAVLVVAGRRSGRTAQTRELPEPTVQPSTAPPALEPEPRVIPVAAAPEPADPARRVPTWARVAIVLGVVLAFLAISLIATRDS